MSEKRFVYEEEHYNFPIKKRIRDTQNNETYDLKKCCGLLNEQQATINEQKEAIEYLKTVIRYIIPNQMVADVFKEIGEEYE